MASAPLILQKSILAANPVSTARPASRPGNARSSNNGLSLLHHMDASHGLLLLYALTFLHHLNLSTY